MAKRKQLQTRESRSRSARVDLARSRFGQRLRQARLDSGMTLNDVSVEREISITYLSDLERGILSNPTLDTLRRLAEATARFTQ